MTDLFTSPLADVDPPPCPPRRADLGPGGRAPGTGHGAPLI